VKFNCPAFVRIKTPIRKAAAAKRFMGGTRSYSRSEESLSLEVPRIELRVIGCGG
jgi:hypothetical protein